MNFSHITIGEIDNAEREHPLATPFLKKIDFFLTCPDSLFEMPFFFYLSENGVLISKIFATPDLLTDLSSQKHPLVWTGGLFTHPDYRRRGYARKLINYMLMVLNEKKIPRASVYSARETMCIYNSIPDTFVGYVPRFLFMKNIAPLLRAHLSLQACNAIVNFLYEKMCFGILRHRAMSKFKFLDYRLELANEIPAIEHDLKITDYKNKCYFNAKYNRMMWKLKNSKYSHDFYFVYDKQSGAPIAYFILRVKYVDSGQSEIYNDYRLMTLVDYGFWGNDRDLLYAVIFEKVISTFLTSDAEILEIISSSTKLLSLAKKALFVPAGPGMSFTFNASGCRDIKYNTSINDWHLTAFSGDAFTFQ